MINLLQGRLSAKNLAHSRGVSSTARALAKRLGYPEDKAALAGLLHDFARDMSKEVLLAEARRFHIHVDPIMRARPMLLHAPVGAVLAKTELGIHDKDILEAVGNHTCGKEDMGLLARIIYVADMTEPSRDFPGVERLRSLVEVDFQNGLILAVESTIRYVLERRQLLHPSTVAFWNKLVEGEKK